MASLTTAEKPRPPKPSGGEWVEYDEFIDRQIRKTREQVKGVEIASALMTLAAGALAFFLVAAVLDHWVLPHGFGFWGRLLCLAMFLSGAGYYAAEKLLPWLIYRINPIYAAQAIEKSRPTLKNSLINFLFLRGQAARMSTAVYQAVEEQAATGLSRVAVESAVDRSRLVRIGYVLLAIIGLFAAYFLFSPKNPWDTVGRVMLPWANIQASTRVEILEVQPGTRTVYRGEPVEVSAEIRGLNEGEPVRVVYSTADHEAVDQPVTMSLPHDRFRHIAEIPAPAAGLQNAAQQDAGVQQDIDYRIEAGDAVSPTYHLHAVTAPTIALESVDYQYPDYTGRPPLTLKAIGDIQSLEGTRITIHGRANQAIKSAQLELDGHDGRVKLPLLIGSDGRTVTGSFALALDEQDRTSPQFSHYRLRPDGDTQAEPVQYRIDVIPDLPPEVKFILPEKDELALPINRRLKLRLRALDPDFALSDLTLTAEANRNPILEERLLKEIRREAMQVDYTINPAKLNLKVGDVIEYWAAAKDNRTPTPNSTQTSRRRIRIVAADARASDSNPGDGSNEGNSNDPSDNSNPADKSNAKKSPSDGANQDSRQTEKKPDDNSPQNKPSSPQQADKPNGASQGADNPQNDQPQDRQQDKSSTDKQKRGSDNISGGNNPGGNNSTADKSADKPAENSAEKSPDNSTAKSDGGKPNGDPSSRGQQNNAGSQQSNGNPSNANQSKQSADQPAKDGSDDAQMVKDVLKHLHGMGKNGPPQSQQEKSPNPSQNPQGQNPSGKDSRGQKPGQAKQQSGNQPQSDERKPTDSQQKPGDDSGKSTDAAKAANGQKPADAQKSGNRSANKNPDGRSAQRDKAPGEKTGDEKSPADQANAAKSDKPNADKPNGDQPSTQDGGARRVPDQKTGPNQPAGDKPSDKAADKSNGADSTKENSPTDASSGDRSNSKSGDKSDKQHAMPNDRDSSSGQNKSGAGNQPDQGKGEQAKAGSQPTGDKPDAQQDKQPSETKSGDPDAAKGKSGAGVDTAKNDQAAPPSPSDANQPKEHKNQKPDSAGKKETQGKDEGNSSTVSPKESDSKGDQDGDRSGGGKKGGGAGAKQSGTGGAGEHTGANQGNGVAAGKGQGDDSDKAGADKKSDHRTGQSGNEKGAGSESRAATANRPDSSKSAQSPDGGNPSGSGQQGSAGKNSSENQSGRGGSWKPQGGGGGAWDPTGPPPPSEGSGDPANAEFAKKQFDMALESLKKGKPDLLKELNWTPEEAQKLADRLERMRRNAEAPGAKGDEARQQLDDILHGLGARSGRLDRGSGGNATDNQRGLRDSRDAGPPPEYSEQVEAFKQGILQSGK